jgi:integrase
MAKKLTALKIEQLKPRATRTEYPDGGCAGLYCVIQPSGKRSWAVRYRRKADGKPRKITLDGSLSLAAARAKAAEYMEHVAKGEDPAAALQIKKQAARAEVEPDDEIFGSVVRKFILRDQKPSNRTWIEVARMLGLKPDANDDKQLIAIKGGLAHRWGKRKFAEIQKRDIIAELDKIVDRGGRGITANRTLAAIRRLFNWAIERDIIAVSPCAGIRPQVEEAKRDRVLSEEEIRWLWDACDKIGQPFGHAIKLLLLTGQRRGEVGEMTDREIDRHKHSWTIPKYRSKNNEAHEVPLSDAALAIMDAVKRIKSDGAYVFTTNGGCPVSGWSKVKRQLDALMSAIAGEEGKKLLPWCIHDLRRTAASGMARLGVQLPVIEKVLNHTSGSFRGIVGVYQRHDFAAEKRAALDCWAREVERIVIGKAAAVVKTPEIMGTR